MTLNKTNWEHAVIAAGIQFLLTMFFCAVATPGPGLIILSTLPGLFLFFGREHAQHTNKLKKDHGSAVITWTITLEALRFWKWPEDTRMDFLLPVAVAVPQTMLQLWVWL